MKRYLPYKLKVSVKQAAKQFPGTRWLRQQYWRYREATAAYRMEPAFAVIGTVFFSIIDTEKCR